MLRVAAVSMKHRAGDVAHNLERHRMWLERALDAGARFIGFPEFSLTGWINEREKALSLDSEPIRQVESWAKKHGVYIATCLVEKRGGRLYNTCVICGPKSRVGVMRKINLVSAESPHYTSGREFPVLRVAGCWMGVTTCADGSYFEMMRMLSFRGAEVIFAPHANSLGVYGNNGAGWLRWRLEEWPHFARRCCVNIVGINNAGLTEDAPTDEEPTKYCGGGAFFDFQGNIIALATVGDTKKECMVVADLDLDALRQARADSLRNSEFRVAIVYNRRDGWRYGRTTTDDRR